MDDYDSYAEALQDHSNAPSLVPRPDTLLNYTYCPWAKCVVGIDPLSDKDVLVGIPCKRWGCEYCAKKKINRLAWMTRNAAPNKLLTLTINSQTSYTPKEVWDMTAPQVPELVRIIRKERGECEYLRVLELHASGYPHYHMLLRTVFLPHAQLLKWWRNLIGPLGIMNVEQPESTAVAGVNIKKIDKSFATFRYLVKYLTKLHKIEWTDRHVSYSKNFFNEADLEKSVYASLDIQNRPDEHPWMYLASRYGHEVVRYIGEGRWELPYQFFGTPIDVDPKSLNLPETRNIDSKAAAASNNPLYVQRQLLEEEKKSMTAAAHLAMLKGTQEDPSF